MMKELLAVLLAMVMIVVFLISSAILSGIWLRIVLAWAGIA